MEKKNFYITTPIYYPSGNLHVGHAYTTILADILARYNKQIGKDVFFLTGSDEHGEKIQQKAEEANVTPQEFVDEKVSHFKHLWNLLDINYDKFIRTTNPNHEETARKIFSNLLEKKHIFKDSYSGLYSVQDEEFITKTNAVKRDGEFFHPQSGHKLVLIEEESYFLELKSQAEWLIRQFKEKENFVHPENRINELINNFVGDGQLQDLSVTRTTFDWGVHIKEDPKHVLYVWIDALSNYISALGYLQDEDKLFNKFWGPETEIVHLVGKEITRFHCIYWPIMLKYLGLRQPNKILAHGWITAPDGGKMSKSKGDVVDPIELIEKYGSDSIRFYLAQAISIGQDGPFSEELLQTSHNTHLANTFGNLVSRFTKMVEKYRDGKVPNVKVEECSEGEVIKSLINDYHSHMSNQNVSSAIECASNIGFKLNEYIERTRPFSLAKEGKEQELDEKLSTIYKYLCSYTHLMSPILVKKSTSAKEQLGIQDNGLTHKVFKGEILFSRYK